jgi:diguanylate cyclase (GGDEF)-like protein
MCAAVVGGRPRLVVPDTTLDPAFSTSTFVACTPHIRSFAGTRLLTPDDHVIGVVCVADTRARSFEDPQLAALEAASLAIMELLEHRRLCRLDQATGALGHAAFLEQAQRMVRLAAHYRRGLSLVVIDVDPFRSLLDSLKADLGRIMVERVAGLGRDQVRRLDSFGRLSENTFGVLLPDTDGPGARVLAQRLTERLAEGWAALIPESVEKPVGIGVASLQAAYDNAESILARAEKACDVSWPGKREPPAPSMVA